MKIITLFLTAFVVCPLAYGQTLFNGLLHQTVGNVELEIAGDTLNLISINPEEVSGVDIQLGSTKGFGFTFTAIDPILNPNGAYQEWRMLGTLNGNENQPLWKETHQVNNQNGLIRTEVVFDTSPIKAEANGIQIIKNGELSYEGIFDNGIIYTIEIDTAIVPLAAICKPKPIIAQWDKTCVNNSLINFPQTIVLPDGIEIDAKSGDALKIVTYAIRPETPPSSCSLVESRSFQSVRSQFHNEGIVMFDDIIPFYAIGDIIYETGSDFLRIFDIDNSGAEGVRIPLDSAKSLDLDWLPITDQGDDFSMEISSIGKTDQEHQSLGTVKHQFDPAINRFRITAEFSSTATINKDIQVLRDGIIVREFTAVGGSEMAIVDEIPIGCGMFAPADIDTLSEAICYYLEFEELTTFVVRDNEARGDEIRILSKADYPVDYISEFKLLLSDILEIVITDASSIATSIIEEVDRKNSFVVFPNPAKKVVAIRLNDEGWIGYKLSVYNNHGNLVASGIVEQNYHELDISSLPNGVYYIQMQDEFIRSIKKFIKMD